MRRQLTICALALLAFAASACGQSAAGRFINLSTRGFVGSGDSVMIVGFVIADDNYYVLARAIGPTLAALGVTGVLARPTIEIIDSDGSVVASNTEGGGISLDLRYDVPAIEKRVGAFPLNPSSRDCSLYLLLRRGAYTMVIRGANNTTGNVLAEIYGVAPLPIAPGSPVVPSKAG